MRTSVIGFPRIGSDRELKFASEKYFQSKITQHELLSIASSLREKHWKTQQAAGIDFIASNDFSFYDNVLDTAVLLNVVPARYRALNLDTLGTYFAMARGYQGAAGDVKALAMKKWFNTNYHYIVPEIDDDTKIDLAGEKPFELFVEAQNLGVKTKPVIVGPFTFLKLARFTGSRTIKDFEDDIIATYKKIVERFEILGADWLQLDEPSLVCDLTADDVALFKKIYTEILGSKRTLKILLQTYFGDVRDAFDVIATLKFDGVGLDFVEGKQTETLLSQTALSNGAILFAGVLNGKNIWAANYEKILKKIEIAKKYASEVVISTSCSLLHVPYTLKNEPFLTPAQRSNLAFAEEKLDELADLKDILSSAEPENSPAYVANVRRCSTPRDGLNSDVQSRVAKLNDDDFVRKPSFEERENIQREAFNFPLLPTTTIGSFPQTAEVRANRAAFKKGEIDRNTYDEFNQEKIAECIKLQESLDIDVLVHGEFERTDMVEYFGEFLDGYLRTVKGWVQSYGTRCVKPPLIWGDISRREPMTVATSVFAQSCTKRPMKGMLTGPVTILNWSFPREDVALSESANQIALAIRDEVLDLEANGIRIIQIDEAALREKLPLRHCDWFAAYLDWAIPAFRLTHSGVKPETQIHTHMCYSEFADIIHAIDDMDADVISFEASRSDLTLIDVLQKEGFKTEVGPGVYDIHSPRIPSQKEIEDVLKQLLKKIPAQKLWVNPDCGLKTRGIAETTPSLANLVQAAKAIRATL